MKRLVLGLLFVAAMGPANAQEFEGSAQPADVLVAVMNFTGDLEAVRQFMGKPPVTLSRFRVEFAAPRHVYYQAQTLFWKTNRLGQEVGGVSKQSPPPAPDGTILPQDVLRTVVLAQGQLDLVIDALGVTVSPSQPRRNDRTQPKDVFEAIVQAIRQVNLMIDDPFRPSDVFEQLNVASVYLAGVLSQAESDELFPRVDFVANKAPIDVYDKLIDCLVVNQSIGEALGVAVLQVRERDLKRDRSILSDNYDIATMIVADTAFWTDQLEYDEDVFNAPQSLKHIFPAHVFAKAVSVERQLKAIRELLGQGRIKRAAAR